MPNKIRKLERNNRGVARHTISLNLGESGATGSKVAARNISEAGILIETETPLAVGDAISVDLPLSGATVARVVWISGTLAGCSFPEPISPADVSAARLQSPGGRNEPPADDFAGPPAASPADQGGPSFAGHLKRLRQAHGLSIDDLARRIQVTRQAVWHWENGRNAPSALSVRRLADVYGVREQDIRSAAAPIGRQDLASIIEDARERLTALLGISADRIEIVLRL